MPCSCMEIPRPFLSKRTPQLAKLPGSISCFLLPLLACQLTRPRTKSFSCSSCALPHPMLPRPLPDLHGGLRHRLCTSRYALHLLRHLPFCVSLSLLSSSCWPRIPSPCDGISHSALYLQTCSRQEESISIPKEQHLWLLESPKCSGPSCSHSAPPSPQTSSLQLFERKPQNLQRKMLQ